jgi:hypothetical protein
VRYNNKIYFGVWTQSPEHGLLGKHSITWVMPSPLFTLVVFHIVSPVYTWQYNLFKLPTKLRWQAQVYISWVLSGSNFQVIRNSQEPVLFIGLIKCLHYLTGFFCGGGGGTGAWTQGLHLESLHQVLFLWRVFRDRVSQNLIAWAGFKPWSSWSLPPEKLGLQAWATSIRLII